MTTPTDEGTTELTFRSAPNTREELETFEGYLRSQGLKVTKQRVGIAQTALEAREHFSADDLVEQARGRGISGASKASVYRTLALLRSAGLLQSHDFERGRTYYEPSYGVPHHDHLVCLRCERIVEFEDADIEASQVSIAQVQGFRMITHNHKIYGLCRACQ